MDPDLIEIDNNNTHDSIKDLNRELNAHSDGTLKQLNYEEMDLMNSMQQELDDDLEMVSEFDSQTVEEDLEDLEKLIQVTKSNHKQSSNSIQSLMILLQINNRNLLSLLLRPLKEKN